MSARLRVLPWKKFFGDKVVVKRDKYLVMGETEEECRRLTVACAFAIQMRPVSRPFFLVWTLGFFLPIWVLVIC